MQKKNHLMLANYSAMIHQGLKGKDKFTSSEIQKVIDDLKYLYSSSN
jgi:hypothetical protein